MTKLTDLLIKHEGMRLKPYKCTAGKLTIGVGRNLDDVGITEWEALCLLNNDVKKFTERLDKLAWYDGLSPVRKMAIADMCFNVGFSGLLKFKNMIHALAQKNFDDAALEMLDSKWADQVGVRAQELADMIRTNQECANVTT